METGRIKQLYTTLPEFRQSHFLRDMTPTLAAWFVAWMIPALTGLLISQSIVQFLFFIGVGYVGGRRYRWGAGITYPLDWFHGWRIKLKKGVVFNAEASSKGSLKINRGGKAISLTSTDFLGVIASVYNPETRVDTVYLRVRGWKSINDSVFDRHNADLRVLRVLKNAISQLADDIGITSITCPRPYNPLSLQEDLQENFLSDEVVNAKPGDGVAYKLQRHINEVMNQQALTGREFYGLYALSVKRPASWQEFVRRPEKFTSDDLRNSPLMRVLSTMAEGLASEGFHEVSIFKREELDEFIFKTWNVKFLQDFFAGESNALRNPGENPWPRDKIIVDGANKVIVIDGNYHRVLVTTRYGIRRVIAGGFQDLMTGNKPWVTMSVPYVTRPKGLESWVLKQQRDLISAIQRERYKGGMIEDRESRDQRQATVDRVDAIYVSGTKPTRSNRFFVVSGPTMQQLEDAQHHLETKLRRKQIRVVPVRGRARMMRAFLAASLGLSL